jgi:iron complex transport system substrate-binding protein
MKKLTRTMLIASIFILSLSISCGGRKVLEATQEESKNVESNRTVTDMAGRQVTVPIDIEKVYSTHSIGTIFVYTLSPHLVAGWNMALTDSEKAFIKEQYHDLPVLGRWKGTGSSNTEQLILAKPDIIINMGDLTESYIAESDEMQKMLNIPVIMVDGSITHQDESYEFLGSLLGQEERAKTLSDYSKSVIQTIQSRVETLGDSDKVPVYYGAGLDGLETIPKGTINTEIVNLVGGINIANPGMENNLRRMQVSMEQLINWNPPVIILSTNSSHNEQLYEDILLDEKWQAIDAVKNNKVYTIPYGPYDWFSQPPTLLRIIGMHWLGSILYPDLHAINLEQEVKKFFSLFFSIELNELQIDQLLRNSR